MSASGRRRARVWRSVSLPVRQPPLSPPSVFFSVQLTFPARENNDTVCLNFALSSLLYLRQAQPNNTTAFSRLSNLLGGSGEGSNEEIAFLKNKAREGRNWSLLSSTLLEEAKVEMYSAVSQPFCH